MYEIKTAGNQNCISHISSDDKCVALCYSEYRIHFSFRLTLNIFDNSGTLLWLIFPHSKYVNLILQVQPARSLTIIQNLPFWHEKFKP